ncbi:hypothetical protein D3C85_1295230 [compost metagenome]
MARMASTMARVASTVPRAPPRSAVTAPEARTAATAASIESASSSRSKLWRSIMAADRTMPTGLARSLPAMSGAEPWIGSNRPGPSAPREAEGSRPMEPPSTEISSDRMSPNMFSVRMTSYSRGLRIRCMAMESTRACSRVICGYSSAWMRVTTSRHRRLVSMTLALSTEVTLPRRWPAAWKAARATRSISSTV